MSELKNSLFHITGIENTVLWSPCGQGQIYTEASQSDRVRLFAFWVKKLLLEALNLKKQKEPLGTNA